MSLSGALPSARAVQRLKVAPPEPGSRVKAMCAPSGDQTGSASKIGAFVTLTGLAPSESMVHTDVVPPRPLTNRILDPSGDQSGSESSERLPPVRFVCPVPSAFIVKTSLLPVRFESNAILVPSGLQAGLRSAPEKFVRFVWPVPSAFMTQMSRPSP